MSDDFIAAVSRSVTEYLQSKGAKQHGLELNFSCPFHQDGENPNLDWQPDKGTYICRSCGASGGAVKLAKALGIDIPRQPVRRAEPVVDRDVQAYHDALLGNPAALAFLRERRFIPEAVVRQFRLGLCSSGTDDKFDFFYPIVTPDGLFRSARIYRPHVPKAKKKGDPPRRFWRPKFSALGSPRPTAPLFGAVEACAANPEWLILCEGEDKALALWGIGIPAAALTAGVGTWRREWARHFKGRHLVYVLDMDPAGLAIQQTVQEYARKVGCASLKFVHLPLPGTPDQKDVTDWLRAGGTRESFLSIANAEPEIPIADQLAQEHDPNTPETGVEHAGNVQQLAATRSGLTELGNSERLARLHGGNYRYSDKMGKFIAWNGQFWTPDSDELIGRWLRGVIDDLYAEAVDLQERAAAAGDELEAKRFERTAKAIKAWAHKSESSGRARGTLSWAQTHPGVPVDMQALDADPYLLNVLNGTLDLRTGKLRAFSQPDLITRQAPVVWDPDATCPTWRSFLQTVMQGNARMISFLQRIAGYSLTGDTRERCLFILYGSGANGKSTFLNTMQAIMGRYARQTPSDIMIQRRDVNASSATPELAALRGVRLAAAVESDEGRRLAEALVKHMTGADRTIAARDLFERQFEFRPQFKLWLGTNHRPVVRGNDPAIWDRIIMIDFCVRLWNRAKGETGPAHLEMDKRFDDKLLPELPGILAWAVEGCLAWQRDGLQAPDEVRASIAEYKSEMDTVGDWLAERCELTADSGAISSHDLFADYREWTRAAHLTSVTPNAFGRRLHDFGAVPSRTRDGGKGWARIRLKTEASHYADSRYEKESSALDF